MGSELMPETLMGIYRRLMDRYGPQHWWPANGPFEVMVGAILTQSAAWGNVEKAIANLKGAGALSPQRLRQLPQAEIAALVYPCGYYNAKAAKVKALACWLGDSFHDDLERLLAIETDRLRHELLGVHGIGEETADSIVLYAANRPVFVIDAYTRRILHRIGLAPRVEKYREYQLLFMDNLPRDVQLFNEYHALLVRLGKDACRRQPQCLRCCLLPGVCSFGQNS